MQLGLGDTLNQHLFYFTLIAEVRPPTKYFCMFRPVNPVMMEFLLCNANLTDMEREDVSNSLSIGSWRESVAADI